MRGLMLLLALLSSAWAGVSRHAVLIGANVGDADEPPLRYAERDARKIRDVLVDLGGFPPTNVTLLAGRDAQTTRATLIAINDRIRREDTQAVLLVYYSGHADAHALHLGGEALALDELEQLVRGSAAEVRLLILDACRSGALTRVKGGRRAPAFALEIDEGLTSEGVIFLTASAAGEDAQESDTIRGSFFTHHLVSGLLGAADVDRDAAISLEEAYRYAYDATLRASSRTLAGPQHPTFRYDVSGKGNIVLTRPHGARRRGALRFPEGRGYLIFAGDEAGAVVAEVGPGDAQRRISLPAGRYFIRGRAHRQLLEGRVEVEAGRTTLARDEGLERIEYARLVRKGGGGVDRARSASARAVWRSPLPNAQSPCWGAEGRHLIEAPGFDLGFRAGACRAYSARDPLEATVDALSAGLLLGRAWDLRALTLAPYLAFDVGALLQRFETPGHAPPRASAYAQLGAGLSARYGLARRLYLDLSAEVQTHGFRLEEARGAEALTLSTALQLGGGLGLRF